MHWLFCKIPQKLADRNAYSAENLPFPEENRAISLSTGATPVSDQVIVTRILYQRQSGYRSYWKFN
jgi:hypothetical protein